MAQQSFLATLAALLCTATATAQSTAFDAASVKVSGTGSGVGIKGGPGTTDPGRIHIGHMPMGQLLTLAYGIEPDRLAGPAWMTDFMGSNVYDVDATIPPVSGAECERPETARSGQNRAHRQVRFPRGIRRGFAA